MWLKPDNEVNIADNEANIKADDKASHCEKCGLSTTEQSHVATC